MESVQQKALLSVIKLAVIPENRIQSRIQSAKGLITIQDNIVSKSIGTTEIIFCSCIVHRWIAIIVDIHLCFALDPTGIVSVHTSCKCHSRKAASAFDTINNCVRMTFCDWMLLAVSRVEISSIFWDLTMPARDHIV